jgi:hypothetical protein
VAKVQRTVATVAEVEIDGPAAVEAAVEHGRNTLIGVYMPGEDHINAVLKQERLHVASHELGFGDVAAVRVVPGRVHHDEQPRRRLAVDRSKVGREPLILQRASSRGGVRAQSDDVHRPNVATPPQVGH